MSPSIMQRRQNTAAESEGAEAAKLKRGKPSLKRREKKKRKKVGACDQISKHVVLTSKLSFLSRYSAGVSTPTIPPFFRHRLDKNRRIDDRSRALVSKWELK